MNTPHTPPPGQEPKPAPDRHLRLLRPTPSVIACRLDPPLYRPEGHPWYLKLVRSDQMEDN